MPRNFERENKEYEEQVVHIDRISRTVAGGRRIRFRAAVVIGNRGGKVGVGVAKAAEVISAVQKAITLAKKNLINVPIVNDTIPHEIETDFGAAKILLKPAAKGTGIIAGGAVRAIANLAGIKNILSKILGSQNQVNNLQATIKALQELENKNQIDKKYNESRKPEDKGKNKETKKVEAKTNQKDKEKSLKGSK